MAGRRVEFQFIGDSRDLERALSRVTAGTEKVRGETDKASKSSTGLSVALDRTEKAGRKMLPVLGGIAAAGTAAAAAFALTVKGAVDFANRASEIAKKAKVIGSSAEEIQLIRGALDLGGVSAEKTDAAMAKLNLRLAEAAQGTGPAVDALNRLGLSAQQLQGLPLPERVAVLADRINGLGTQGEKTAVAMRLMEEGGIQLLSAFEGGGEAIRAATEEIAAAGVVSNEGAAQAEAMSDQVALLARRFQFLKDDALSAVLPDLIEAGNQIANIIDQARESGALQDLARSLIDVGLGALEAAKGVASFLGVEFKETNRESILKARINADEENVKGQRALLREMISQERDVDGVLNALEDTKDRLAANRRELVALQRARVERTRGGGDGGGDGEPTARPSAMPSLDDIKSQAKGEIEAEEDLADQKLDVARSLREQLLEIHQEFDEEEVESARRREEEKVRADRDAAQQRVDLGNSVLLASSQTFGAIAQLSDVMRQHIVAGDQDLTEEKKKQLMALWGINKTAAVAQAGVNLALGISSAIGNAPNPIVGAIMGIAAGIAGGIALAAVIAEPPPQFHTGGMISAAGMSDEIMVRARRNEAILSPQGVAAAGGAAGVGSLNRGRGVAGGPTAVVMLNNRIIDVQTNEALRRTGSPLDRAIRRGSPVGRHNPHRRQ